MDNKAASSSGSLTLKDWERFTAQVYEQNPQDLTLVAPNKEIAEQWAIQYPRATIVLSAKHLPTHTSAKAKERKI